MGAGQDGEASRDTVERSCHVARASFVTSVILLVEDNRDMRDYIARLLRSDYEVIQASDGLEALKLALMRLLLI